MRSLGGLVVLVIGWAVGAVALGAQGPIRSRTQIPEVGRPAGWFSYAIGSRVQARFQAEPTEIVLGEAFTLTLTIASVVNPAEVERPPLRDWEEFADFQIEDVPDPPDAITVQQRRFVYRVRPRRAGTFPLPALEIAYFDPTIRPPANKPELAFPRTFTDVAGEVQVTVRPAPPQPATVAQPLILVELPPTLSSWKSPEQLSRSLRGTGQWTQGGLWWGIGIAFPPIVALSLYLVWRSNNPDAARLAQLRRQRAARRLLDALRHWETHGDTTAYTFDAALAELRREVQQYLHDRWGLPATAQTGNEIANFLQSTALAPAEAPAEVAAEVVRQLFAMIDALRFAPKPCSPEQFRSCLRQAESALLSLEAQACSR